jgi:hypothetical protein
LTQFYGIINKTLGGEIMDNIIFEKVWIDSNPIEDFFQIKMFCSNERISMESAVYTNSKQLKALSEKINKLPQKSFCEVFGNDDDSNIDCVAFDIRCLKTGKVIINVKMKSMVDTETNDKASFVLKTDLAVLDEFSNEFNSINSGNIGTVIELNKNIQDI